MNEGGFGYWDENDNTRAMMTGENISCHDDNGNMRVLMADEASSTGTTTATWFGVRPSANQRQSRLTDGYQGNSAVTSVEFPASK